MTLCIYTGDLRKNFHEQIEHIKLKKSCDDDFDMMTYYSA